MKKTKILKTILPISFAITSLSAITPLFISCSSTPLDQGAEIITDGILEFKETDGGSNEFKVNGFNPEYKAKLLANPPTQYDLVIPGAINGKVVTIINSDAFKDLDFISRVFIPKTVSWIGISAFQNCKNLKTVIFENNSIIYGISENSFQNTNITKFVIPKSVDRIFSLALDSGYLTDLYIYSPIVPDRLHGNGHNVSPDFINQEMLNNPSYYKKINLYCTDEIYDNFINNSGLFIKHINLEQCFPHANPGTTTPPILPPELDPNSPENQQWINNPNVPKL